MSRKYILFAFLLSLTCSLSAQEDYDFTRFKRETGLFLRQPGEWGTKDWLTLGAVGAGTFETHQYDESIKDSAFRHRKNGDSFPVRVGEQWGGFFVTPVLGVSLLSYGWLADSAGPGKLGFEILQSALYAEAVSVVMKTVIGRARPVTGKNSGTYIPFSLNKSSYNSFPGGHVDAAFSLATVLSRSTDSTVLKVLPYVPAGLTAASRIYKKAHWASDCFFGAAIGYFTADWVMDLHEKGSQNGGGASGPKIRPYFAEDAAGLSFSVNI